MIDKSLINARFLECVDLLISVDKTDNKGSIAQKINIKPSKFSEILNKRMSVGLEDLAVFSKEFNFNCNYILLGEEPIRRSVKSAMNKNDLINEVKENNNLEDSELLIKVLQKQIEDLKADKERLYKLLESKEGNQKTA